MVYSLTVFFVSVMFLFYQNIAYSDVAFVKFVNVGQGDCTLITLPGDIDILIDGGEYSKGSENNPESNTVCSYLARAGVKDIDLIIATHANSDHIGGLLSVIDCFKVGALIVPPTFLNSDLSLPLMDKAMEKNVSIYIMLTEDTVTITDTIKLTALMPDIYTIQNEENENNTSLVFRLDCYGTSFLFMGDIEAETEFYMTRLLNDDILDVDVLKVGHHGSDTSSSEAFLEKVTPEFAFIPVGENSFGHPSSEVLDRLSAMGTTVFRADMNKDVIFVLTIDGISNIIYS